MGVEIILEWMIKIKLHVNSIYRVYCHWSRKNENSQGSMVQIHHSKITNKQKLSSRFPCKRVLVCFQMSRNNFSWLLCTNITIQTKMATSAGCLPKWGLFKLPTRAHFWDKTLWGAFPDLPVLLVLLWIHDFTFTFHALSFHIICCMSHSKKKPRGNKNSQILSGFPTSNFRSKVKRNPFTLLVLQNSWQGYMFVPSGTDLRQ